MIIRIFILLFIVLIGNVAIAANKQFLVPGYGFVDQKTDDEQWLLPGYGFMDEETGGAPPASTFIPRIIISRKEKFIEKNIKIPIDTNGIILVAQWYHIRSNCK